MADYSYPEKSAPPGYNAEQYSSPSGSYGAVPQGNNQAYIPVSNQPIEWTANPTLFMEKNHIDNTVCCLGCLMGWIFSFCGLLCIFCVPDHQRRSYLVGCSVNIIIGVIMFFIWLVLIALFTGISLIAVAAS